MYVVGYRNGRTVVCCDCAEYEDELGQEITDDEAIDEDLECDICGEYLS